MSKRMSFNEIVEALESIYRHHELWLSNGLPDTCPSEIAFRVTNWKSAKILNRKGFIVAEQIGGQDEWEFRGNYRAPFTGNCSPPRCSCLIDKILLTHLILNR